MGLQEKGNIISQWDTYKEDIMIKGGTKGMILEKLVGMWNRHSLDYRS